jgi:hypothetical protein
MAFLVAVAIAAFATTSHAQAQSGDSELASKLSNPVASMISVPFQFNWDHELGPERNGRRFQLNIQPVVPSKLNDEWTLISRVIVPIVDQRIPSVGDGSQSGVGDITGEFFFTPKPGPGSVIWGIGPAILIPTGTDFISADKWGLGSTAVVLKQESGWTYGALANHIWSVGGSGSQDISSTFIQPFVAYTTKDAWTFNLTTESTYDWKHSQWTVPVIATVPKLIRIGKQPVSFGAAARYYADSPDTGPHGWGVRLVVTLLFPQPRRLGRFAIPERAGSRRRRRLCLLPAHRRQRLRRDARRFQVGRVRHRPASRVLLSARQGKGLRQSERLLGLRRTESRSRVERLVVARAAAQRRQVGERCHEKSRSTSSRRRRV